MIRVSKATPRKTPRPFRFHWGSGYVTEEVSIKCSIVGHSWEPTIQLLEYDDGMQQLRFCVYNGKRFQRMSLLIGSEEMGALAQQVRKSKQIKNLMRKLA
ncbi:MAG TPA: hypothetical protein VI698_00370 [Nitrososphaerales archaeon]|nr:hypothetical protein [Nitrososphaerales archaeon]